MNLGTVWSKYPELFQSQSLVFPLLTKILDASDDLSVQVHPDDLYAGKYENGGLGKTECWYIIDAEPDSSIIYGHNAASKKQLERMIYNGEWDTLLTKIPVKPGDFFYVPSGTIHALGKGIVVLETQQSSDTTYRVYDYERMDKNGDLRELHLEKAIDVTTTPQAYEPVDFNIEEREGRIVTTLVSNSFFTVEKWEINGHATFTKNEKYLLGSIISGDGYLHIQNNKYTLKKGSHFILPVDFGPYEINGELQLIISSE